MFNFASYMNKNIYERTGQAARILERFGCSLVVIDRGGEVRTFYNKGVRDLYTLLKRDPGFMDGAAVADKMVGAGAAVLMCAGKIGKLFTFVASEPAAMRLVQAGIPFESLKTVPNIINRAGTDICPVEKLVGGIEDYGECIDRIGVFLSER